MIFTNVVRALLTTSIAVICFTTISTNAMMGWYLTALAGDLFFTAGMGSLKLTVKNGMTNDDHKELKERASKQSDITQLKCDAVRVAPYAPVLVPGGMVLSVGSRLSMLKGPRGLMFAAGSVPLNAMLIGMGYNIRLLQSPDAGITDKVADTGSDLLNKMMGWKKS